MDRRKFYDLQADINQNTNLLSQTLSENQQLNYNSLCDSLNLLLGISSPCTNYQVALPISLLKFNGTHDDNKNILSWSSATEVNSEKYVVQRSTDAKIFEEIGIVQAGGNTNEIQNYQFTDEGVTERLYYYRLNMVDSDGKSALSHIISVTNNMVIGHFDVLQNPSNSILTIQYKDGALMHDTDVKLYDTKRQTDMADYPIQGAKYGLSRYQNFSKWYVRAYSPK